MLPLPALNGNSPLGILAAIGVLRLLDEHSDDRPSLAWSTDALVAQLVTAYSSVGEVVEVLQAIIDDIPRRGVLPGVSPDFPPLGEAPDKLRLAPAPLKALAETLTSPEELEWLCSLITDLALDDSGRSAISLFAAPSGKQSTRTMLQKPLDLVRSQPDLIREALQGWRRYPGVTGEYLDHRAIYDATESSDGAKGQMRGVPGATWLALMSYPLFRTTANGSRVVTSGWHRSSRRNRLVLPVWEIPLDCRAVTALIEHPLLGRAVDRTVDGDRGTLASSLRALGVVDLCRAERRQPPGSKSAGVLTVTT